MYPLLIDVLILLAVSIPVSFLCNKLKLPSIVGFLVTGMIVGPHAAGWIAETEAVRAMAEIGVVLLLFTIGVEFSFEKLFSEGPKFIWLGLAQVVTTVVATAVLSHTFGLPLRQCIFLGFLFALSSTAIVLRILADRSEIDSPHGRLSIGILIFQDICVIPMMLLVPTLAGEAVNFLHVAKQLGLAVLAIAVLILAARYIVPKVLGQVVQLRNRDVFLITILFICLGTAYATSSMGLSLAIGAFIAGLVISESVYSHQILSEILPFRDIFNAIFFVSVGMLLDFPLFLQNWSAGLLTASSILIGKAALILLILLISKITFRISWITAFCLAQVGEFSLLLAQEGNTYKLLPENVYQIFLSSSILTMILTPFVILLAAPIGLRIQRMLKQSLDHEEPGKQMLKDHLVIIGFGLNGKNLARVVRDIGIPFLVVELNSRLVKDAHKENIPVLFGDATRKEVLQLAGVQNARVVAIAISDMSATRSVVAMVRNLSPNAVILVRTRYVAEVDSLMRLGADTVIPEEFETSIEIFSRVLEQYNIPDHLIDQQVAVIRSGSYGMLRGLSLTQERLLKITELFLKSTVQQVVIGTDSPAKNQSLQELELRKETGASVIAIVRGEDVINNPGGDFRLQENDVVVLWGAHAQLAEALKRLVPPHE
ncbi:cation:proton antiporter [bacterium]|nr:cation:proton antiporter [bacterium]